MSQFVIAKRYAKALVHLVKDKDLETVSQELSSLTQVWTGSGELRQIISDPKIRQDAKEGILKQVLQKLQVQPLVQTFTRYLLSKRRIVLLPEIEQVFAQLVREKLGYLDAEVTVAKTLAAPTILALEKQLSQYSGKKVTVTQQVDPAIIGGIVTRLGSVVIDGSLRHQLIRVRQSIIRG